LPTSFPCAWCGGGFNKITTSKVNSNEQTEIIQDESDLFRFQRERRLQRDGGAGATVKLTLADGTELTRSVAIGE
jgi:hypothetical protein